VRDIGLSSSSAVPLSVRRARLNGACLFAFSNSFISSILSRSLSRISEVFSPSVNKAMGSCCASPSSGTRPSAKPPNFPPAKDRLLAPPADRTPTEVAPHDVKVHIIVSPPSPRGSLSLPGTPTDGSGKSAATSTAANGHPPVNTDEDAASAPPFVIIATGPDGHSIPPIVRTERLHTTAIAAVPSSSSSPASSNTTGTPNRDGSGDYHGAVDFDASSASTSSTAPLVHVVVTVSS